MDKYRLKMIEDNIQYTDEEKILADIAYSATEILKQLTRIADGTRDPEDLADAIEVIGREFKKGTHPNLKTARIDILNYIGMGDRKPDCDTPKSKPVPEPSPAHELVKAVEAIVNGDCCLYLQKHNRRDIIERYQKNEIDLDRLRHRTLLFALAAYREARNGKA